MIGSEWVNVGSYVGTVFTKWGNQSNIQNSVQKLIRCAADNTIVGKESIKAQK